LEFLGKGGFGQVTKVRNKLDDRVYAIKKVKINPKEMEYNKKILREVHTLSRLHHEYVVRYYQAWLESTSVSVGTSLGTSSQGDLNVTATVTFDYSASEDSSASRHNDWLSADVSTNAAPSNSSANPLFRMSKYVFLSIKNPHSSII
jgi:translation initiation factor 2-alpha kinase 4